MFDLPLEYALIAFENGKFSGRSSLNCSILRTREPCASSI